MRIDIIGNMLIREAGPADGPPILFLHGFGDSGTMFTPLFATSLAKHHRLIAADLPGFGATPWQSGLTSIAHYGHAAAELAHVLARGSQIGLVGHSIASPIALAAARALGPDCNGFFSIEGNLTPDDAYFSGQAADYSDADTFKQAMLAGIWARAQEMAILQRYYAELVHADPQAMWRLGCDARRLSSDDTFGREFAALATRKLYYWSRDNTPASTIAWLEASDLPQLEFFHASHWPSVDAPGATAAALYDFFK